LVDDYRFGKQDNLHCCGEILHCVAPDAHASIEIRWRWRKWCGWPSHGNNDTRACSDKEKELVLKIVEQHKLDKNRIEKLAKDMLG
jgi:hypothetical protein